MRVVFKCEILLKRNHKGLLKHWIQVSNFEDFQLKKTLKLVEKPQAQIEVRQNGYR